MGKFPRDERCLWPSCCRRKAARATMTGSGRCAIRGPKSISGRACFDTGKAGRSCLCPGRKQVWDRCRCFTMRFAPQNWRWKSMAASNIGCHWRLCLTGITKTRLSKIPPSEQARKVLGACGGGGGLLLPGSWFACSFCFLYTISGRSCKRHLVSARKSFICVVVLFCDLFFRRTR